MNPDFSFADRTDWDLSTNRLSGILTSLRDRQVRVYDLTVSNPTRCGFIFPDEDILAAFKHKNNLVYTPSAQGLPSARDAVAAYYRGKNITVDPENIFLTSSTSEGYAYLFRLLANPGDRILFPKPSYPLFSFLGDLNDVTLEYYHLDTRNHFQVNFETVHAALSPDCKAAVIVNPNNPTGSYISNFDLDVFNQICRKQAMALICDEVFHDYCLDAFSAHKSLADNRDVLTFTLSGLSKILGFPQMKLSWICISGPDALVREARQRLDVIADTYLSVSTPVQLALPEWLGHMDEIQNQIRQRTKNNLETMRVIFTSANGSSIYLPQGGWYAGLDIGGRVTDEDFALKMLEEDHVFLHPGYFFDFDDEQTVILSLLTPENDFEEGCRRIGARLLGLNQ